LASTNQSDIRTFRHKTNWICAPIAQIILAGVWVLGDPLALRGPYPDGNLTAPVAVFIPAAMGVVGVVTMAFAWYSRVDVTDDRVVIRNPLRDVTIRGGVDAVDRRSRHVRIKVGERWYRCWGAETSLGMQLWQEHTSSSAQLAAALARHRREADALPKISWRKPSKLEVVVLVFWSALVIFSAIHGVNGS
jgi:hypothetical protein